VGSGYSRRTRVRVPSQKTNQLVVLFVEIGRHGIFVSSLTPLLAYLPFLIPTVVLYCNALDLYVPVVFVLHECLSVCRRVNGQVSDLYNAYLVPKANRSLRLGKNKNKNNKTALLKAPRLASEPAIVPEK